LRSSFQLIDENSDVSGDRVTSLKQFIVKKIPYQPALHLGSSM